MSRSIMHNKEDGTCYLCMMLNDDYSTWTYLEEHHVFGGWANRRLSEKFGLKVYLCLEHHQTGKNAVHMDKTVRMKLQQRAQKAFMEKYPDKNFMSIFGKNYIYEDPKPIQVSSAAGFRLLEE